MAELNILHNFCRNERYESVLCYLLNHGDPSKRNMMGETALHVAVYKGSVDICLLLLEAGADPNVTDSMGRTPIYIALAKRRLNICKLLLAYYAIPQISLSTTCFDISPDISRLRTRDEGVSTTYIPQIRLFEEESSFCILEHHQSNPLRLEDICCVFLRKYLGLRGRVLLRKLPLPPLLIKTLTDFPIRFGCARGMGIWYRHRKRKIHKPITTHKSPEIPLFEFKLYYK